MIKKNKWHLILSSMVILLPILIGLLIWNYLPEQTAVHWGGNGEANGWSSKGFAIFGMPVILLAIHWICIFFTAFDPKNKEQNRKVFQMVLWMMPVISLVICGLTYAVALGNDIKIELMMHVLLGVVFVVIGNYMPKCRQNHTIGIKVTWTLRNEENWYQTHRFAGKMWVFGGVFFLATLFVPMESYGYIFLVFVFLMAFAPMIYSYVYYRKQLRAGTATKEDGKMTPVEQKTTRISLAAAIIILAFAMLFVFTGEFDVVFDENSFTVDAAYWEDAVINYAEIDKIEYRNQDDPKASQRRVFGYGGFTLLMGEFESSEFGRYTRYSYQSCDACVVLTVEDKVLVINGKDEEDTKIIYEELRKRVEAQ